MKIPSNNQQIQDYRDFLDAVALVYSAPEFQPSIQLAKWCEAKLPAGKYRVRYRDEDGNFEIYTEGLASNVFLATWPDPAIIGAPKPMLYVAPPREEPTAPPPSPKVPVFERNDALLGAGDAPP
jgi:hypothetical protein